MTQASAVTAADVVPVCGAFPVNQERHRQVGVTRQRARSHRDAVRVGHKADSRRVHAGQGGGELDDRRQPILLNEAVVILRAGALSAPIGVEDDNHIPGLNKGVELGVRPAEGRTPP